MILIDIRNIILSSRTIDEKFVERAFVLVDCSLDGGYHRLHSIESFLIESVLQIAKVESEIYEYDGDLSKLGGP